MMSQELEKKVIQNELVKKIRTDLLRTLQKNLNNHLKDKVSILDYFTILQTSLASLACTAMYEAYDLYHKTPNFPITLEMIDEHFKRAWQEIFNDILQTHNDKLISKKH